MGHALAIMTSGVLLVPERRNISITAGPYRVAFTLPGGTGHFLPADTLIPIGIAAFGTVVTAEGGTEPRVSILALAEEQDGDTVRLTYSVYEILELGDTTESAIAPGGGRDR